jgi:hypothetical protein
MTQVRLNSGVDTGGLRGELDGAGYESVDISSDGDGSYLDIPEDVDALAVTIFTRSSYRVSLLTAMRSDGAADSVIAALSEALSVQENP